MAKPKKQTTLQEDLTSTIQTVKDATIELTEIAKDFGVIDSEGSPLLKDESTMPLEAPTEPLQVIVEETDTDVAQTEETPSSIGLEPLNATEQLGELLDGITEENKHPDLIPTVELDSPPVDDKLTLKDAWGRPVPTTLITLQTVNYTELVSQVLYAAYLGAELDRSYRIMTTVPYRIRLLLPTENYEKWISKEDVMVYDENVSYNKVLVRGFSLYPFWDNVVKVGKSGAMVVPRTVAQKVAGYMVSCYTRAPIADTPESRLNRVKVKYSKEELESFGLDMLKIVASWYDIPPSNSKLKYVKAILGIQGI